MLARVQALLEQVPLPPPDTEPANDPNRLTRRRWWQFWR
jgi:hypothetical protein